MIRVYLCMMGMYINAKCHPDEVIVHTDFFFFFLGMYVLILMYIYYLNRFQLVFGEPPHTFFSCLLPFQISSDT